ncbi:MAG: TMAO reductase system protein TorT [Clostridia bacterium]|nr:TMAO reductase system protein TorT [Clostridia bacterium]
MTTVVRRGGTRLALLLAALLLASCGAGPGTGGAGGGASEGALTIGVSVPDSTEAFWTSIAYGVEDEAKKKGVQVVLVSAGGDANVDKQISQIQDLVQRGVDALIVGATNGDGVVPVVEQAVAKGIPVIGLSSIPNTDKIASAVGADHYGMGKLQAECLGKLLGGKGKVAMMAGPSGQSWAEERARGFKETMAKEFPGVEIVAENHTSDNRNAATTLMEDWLQRFPDLNGVYSASDDIGAGAVDAIKAAGKTGSILISSSNLSPISEEYLKEGLLACDSTQQIVLQGRVAVDQAVNAATGQPVEKNVVTSVILVDKDSLATMDFSNIRAPEGWTP